MDRFELGGWLQSLHDDAALAGAGVLAPDSAAHLILVDDLWVLVSLDEEDQRLRIDVVLADPPESLTDATLHRELLRWHFERPYDLQHLQFALAADGTVVCHSDWPLEPDTPLDTLTEQLHDLVDAVQDAWCQVCAQGLLALAARPARSGSGSASIANNELS